MSKCTRFCNTRILDSFAAKIRILHDTVHAESPSWLEILSSLRILYEIKGLSRIVIKAFLKDWQEASCRIYADDECAEVLEKAVTLKDRLVASHVSLCTKPSVMARWAGRRLTGPVLDWNDLILDLSLASDPEIRHSLSELEEVL